MVTWAISAWLAGLPLAIGAAVLRYRLDDLDRIVSRTLAYGLLTLLLGGGYAVVVLGLGQLLGQDSSLVVAAATLAVAAVFQPLRRPGPAGGGPALQPPPPRRRRDDPGVQRSAARSGGSGHASAELLAVVEETMQPNQASLWQ